MKEGYKTYSNIFFYHLIILSILLFACTSSNKAHSHKQQFRQIYISQFKLTYFRRLLLRSYSYSAPIRSVVDLDKSGFTEPILTIDDYHLIDSLTDADNNQLVTDSAYSIGRVAEGGEGKHIFELVISKLESKWLDSLSKKRYRLAKVSEQYPEW